MEHKYFIVCIPNKIHLNGQHHLTNCQRDWSFINWNDINFEDLQRAIVTDIFVVEKSNWVKEKYNKKSKERSYSSGNNLNADRLVVR